MAGPMIKRPSCAAVSPPDPRNRSRSSSQSTHRRVCAAWVTATETASLPDGQTSTCFGNVAAIASNAARVLPAVESPTKSTNPPAAKRSRSLLSTSRGT